MILCKVTGFVTLPTRLPVLGDAGFVLVTQEGGGTFVAADTLGVSVGNHVLVCQGENAQTLLGGRCPIDAAVICVVLQ
jgi:microcompartment protein CcmK/EutM